MNGTCNVRHITTRRLDKTAFIVVFANRIECCSLGAGSFGRSVANYIVRFT